MRTNSVRAVAHSIFFRALVTSPLRLSLICDALGRVLRHRCYTKSFHEKAGERQVISFFFSLFFIPRVFHRKTSRQDGLAATIASSVNPHSLPCFDPSLTRPVDVQAHFLFLLSLNLFPFSQAAPVAILPSALFGERYSLGARWVFSLQ
jgi:hypothetical protein